MIRRYTTAEYYNSLKTQAEASRNQDKENRGIARLENSIPSAKTCDTINYLHHVNYVLMNASTLYEFYGPEDGKLRYFRYKNQQKAISEAANIVVNGGKKYRKIKNGNTKRNRRRKRTAKKKMNNSLNELIR